MRVCAKKAPRMAHTLGCTEPGCQRSQTEYIMIAYVVDSGGRPWRLAVGGFEVDMV